MKAIERCCECAYYSMRKHKCKRGAKDKGEPTASFYADCPLDEAEIMRHGRWKYKRTTGDGFAIVECTECGENAFAIAYFVKEKGYCPNCGAKMDGVDDDAQTD